MSAPAFVLPPGLPRPVPETDQLDAPYWEGTRGGAVVLHAAVVEPEGLHDEARGVVRLGGKRPAVHDRARVRLRVMVGRERDGPLRLGSHAVVVHEAHDPHREALGG